ncbi:MAG: hypothetical protein JW724_02615 [Candidatus Altiarchaeota archaeon]|nr:hypothetical protein [Candidatus Altiarchaeota archaeon]
MTCTICDRGEAAKILGVCLPCIRERPEEAWVLIKKAHRFARASRETREMNEGRREGFCPMVALLGKAMRTGTEKRTIV